MASVNLHQEAAYDVGRYLFVPDELELRDGDVRKPLTPALNRLLLLLASNRGELVTREQIAEVLWESPSAVDTVAGINTAVRRLRTILGDNHEHGTYIQTVVGAGYRFIAPVRAVEETKIVAPAARVTAPAVDAAIEKPGTFAWRRGLIAAGGLLLIAAMCLWTYSLWQRSRKSDLVETRLLEKTIR